MFNLIGNSLTKYVDFQGRATRKEFWSFFLFFNVITFIAGGIDGFYGFEFALKNHYADKTNWQKMLKNEVPAVDLVAEHLKLENLIPTEVQEFFFSTKDDLYELQYPVLQYPTKVSSLNLDKSPNFSGKLTGVKGQYLLFEDGTVFNVRTFEGYVVKISI